MKEILMKLDDRLTEWYERRSQASIEELDSIPKYKPWVYHLIVIISKNLKKFILNFTLPNRYKTVLNS